MSEAKDAAPDFGPGYPSRGERLGPAWQAVWNELADGAEHHGPDLIRDMAKIHGVAPNTVRALLTKAAALGYLRRRKSFDEQRHRLVAYYRRVTFADIESAS